MVNQLMASAYEHAGNLEQALAFYDTLSTIPGFAALGYMESGRVYELQGQTASSWMRIRHGALVLGLC